MKLLVAGGNALVLRLVRGVFHTMAEIEECGNAENAVAAYSRWRPDFLLADAALEENASMRAIINVRTAFPDAQIIVLADYDDLELKARALSAGAADYVLKENLLSLAEKLKLFTSGYDEAKS